MELKSALSNLRVAIKMAIGSVRPPPVLIIHGGDGK